MLTTHSNAFHSPSITSGGPSSAGSRPASSKQRRGSSTPTAAGSLPRSDSYSSSKTAIPPNLDVIRQWSVADSHEELGRHITSLSKAAVNRRDIFGRTLLHLAAPQHGLSVSLVEALLNNSQVDTSIVDYESGWTPLHSALAHGNFTVAQMILAHSPETAAIRDKAGQRPLDLLRSMTFPLRESFEVNSEGASGLLTFGSNTNHNLGFADGDDKAVPREVKIQRDLSISRHLFTKSTISPMDIFLNEIGDENDDSDDNDSDSDSEARRRIRHGSKLAKIPVDAPTAKFLPLNVMKACISKYHSAVISSDDIGNLYVAGSSRGGRLGFGDHPNVPSTQFTFRQIPFFSAKTVVDVALGHSHTLALTAEGTVFSFGTNEYGQLGYPTPSIRPGAQYPEQHSPQEVTGATLSSGERIIGITASRIHSVAYSEHCLLIWGKNIGQMGFTRLETSYDVGQLYNYSKSRRRRSSANVVNGSTDSVGQPTGLLNTGIDPKDGGIVQVLPRVYAGIANKILQASACEIATVYLCEDHCVWVLMNDENFKIKFPRTLDNPPDRAESFAAYQVKTPLLGRIVKITTSAMGYVCAVDDVGVVYTFNLRPHYVSPATMDAMSDEAVDGKVPLKGHLIAKNIKVKVMWKADTAEMAAVDADVADDGSVIVCTRQGTAWKSVLGFSKNKSSASKQNQGVISNTVAMYAGAISLSARYSYEQILLANRVFKVACDSLFSSFALLRSDYTPDVVGVNYSLSKIEFAHLLPRIEAGDTYPLNEYLSSTLPKQNFSTLFPRNKSKPTGSIYGPIFENERSPMLAALIGNSYLYMSFPGDSIRPYFPDHIERHFDVEVFLGEKKIGSVHSLFLLARVPSLQSYFTKTPSSNRIKLVNKEGDIHVSFDRTQNNSGVIGVLRFSGVKSTTVESIISYIYTDDFFFGRDRLPSPPFFESEGESDDDDLLDKEDIRMEIYRLSKLLGIMKGGRGSMSIIFNSNIEKQSTLGSDMAKILDESYLSCPKSTPSIAFNSSADVSIVLKDGVHVYLHSFILSNRSAYFAAIFSQRWYNPSNNNSESNSQIVFQCELPEIPVSVFQVVIEYIYGDFGIELFNRLKGERFQDVTNFLDFVKEVWACADFLTLIRLCDICQAALAEFITRRNVCEMLELCIKYDGFKLQTACLQYIFENLEFLFENGFLSDLSVDGFERITRYCQKRFDVDTPLDSLSRLFLFINDIETHNEEVSRLSLLDQFQTKSKDASRHNGKSAARHSTDDNEMVFDMDDEVSVSSRRVSFSAIDSTHSMNTTPSNSSGWSVVGARKPSFPSSSRAAVISSLSSSLTPSVAAPISLNGSTSSLTKENNTSSFALSNSSTTPLSDIGSKNESSFPSLGSWSAKDRRQSSGSSEGVLSTAQASSKPSKLQQALRPSSSRISASNSASTPVSNPSISSFTSVAPVIVIKPAKMSKKERKRLQQQQEEEEKKISAETADHLSHLSLDKPTTSSPWKITAPRPVTTSGTPLSPFAAAYSNGPSSSGSSAIPSKLSKTVSGKGLSVDTKGFPKVSDPPSSSSSIPHTLADIIEQEKIFTEIKVQQSRKSFKEIQEEEEFARWWEMESAKAQQEERNREERSSKANQSTNGNNKLNKPKRNRRSGKREPSENEQSPQNQNPKGKDVQKCKARNKKDRQDVS